mgnify:CR=1 FL=1
MSDGGFRMHSGGEADIRGAYCALAVASITNLMDEALVDKAAALICGYQRVRPLTPEEGRAMPVLARGAALRFLLTRAHDWIATPKDAIVKPHDPADYVARILQYRQMTRPADYGIED